MIEQRLVPRHVVPYLVSGASSLHILLRMWRLHRRPANDAPLHVFLLNHTDVLFVLSAAPVVVWRIAKRHPPQPLPDASTTADRSLRRLIAYTAHELRQVFTVLRLGLGVIRRKVITGKTLEIPPLVRRLQHVVTTGIDAVNGLDPPTSLDQRERAVNEE
jgi:hypothetical protein